MALRPVFPADFLPADLVVGAISDEVLLANAHYSTKQRGERTAAAAESNCTGSQDRDAIHTDRGSRCGG
jgi:hypothetical protein